MRNEIPSRWLDRVRRYTRETSGEERSNLSAHDFQSDRSVRLLFPDGSFALFRYAFFLRDEELGEIAVFTEHCGYHFFPAGELQADTQQTVYEEGSGER